MKPMEEGPLSVKVKHMVVEIKEIEKNKKYRIKGANTDWYESLPSLAILGKDTISGP